MNDGINEFEIKSPKLVLILLIVLTVIISVCMIFCICFAIIAKEYPMFVVAAACAIFLIFLGVLYYVYFKEKFILKDEVYTYIKPFSAAQSVAVKDIALVHINNGIFLAKVFFIDKNGNVAMHFIDDGTSFRSGEFMGSLIQRQIPIEH